MNEYQAVSLLDRRQRKFYEARKAGFSYREIGRDMRVSATRAQQIIVAAQKKIAALKTDEEGWTLLSVRAQNCIYNFLTGKCYPDESFRASKAQVRDAISKGLLPTRRRNLGKKTFKEICEWAGVPKVCSCCGQVIQT